MDVEDLQDWELENLGPGERINRMLQANTDVKNPEQTTLILFSITNHQELRLFIYRMITAAFSKDTWADGTGADFISKFRLLSMGIHIAYKMNSDRMSNHDAFPYIHDPKSDAPFSPSSTFLLSNIPPLVSLHEMAAPQITMRNFFKFLPLDQWEELLREIEHCALSPVDYRDLNKPYPSLLIFTHLSKLVDALEIVYNGYRHM